MHCVGTSACAEQDQGEQFLGFRIAKTLNGQSVWYRSELDFTAKAFIGSGLATTVLVFVVLWLGKVFSLGPVALQLRGPAS